MNIGNGNLLKLKCAILQKQNKLDEEEKEQVCHIYEKQIA